MRWIMLFCLSFSIITSADAEPKTPTDKIVDAFMALDSDASESVSFDEYKAMVDAQAKNRYAQMDRNHDGEVTDEEYRAFWQQRKARWYRLKR